MLTMCTSAPAADAPDPDGELRTVKAGDPGLTDPQRLGNVAQIDIALMVYEGLLRLDPKTLRPVPAAAKELPAVSADGRTYRFNLRDGLTYSDGSRLTAKDFAYSLGRLCDPAVGSSYGAVAYVIVGCRDWAMLDPTRESAQQLKAARDALFARGIVVKGELELELTLTGPAAYFSAFLATWVSSPVRESDVVRGGDRWWLDPALYIGNGPFVLVERNEERLAFVANPRARVPPKLKKWTKVIAEPAVSFVAYRNAEIDLLTPRPEDMGAVDGDAALRAQLLESPGACTFYVRFDTTRAPFDDPKLRLALAKSLDRDALVRELKDGSRPALSLIPPGLPGYDADDAAQRFDPDAARKLLAESRAAARPLGAIRWQYVGSAATTAIEAIARQWKSQLGVELVPELLTNVAFAELVRRPEDRPRLLHIGWCADYPDQQNWLTTLFDSGTTVQQSHRFTNPTFDQLVREADRDQDVRRRDDLYLRASRLLSTEAGAVWLRYSVQRVLRQPWVGGLNFGSYGAGVLNPQDVYVTRRKP